MNALQKKILSYFSDKISIQSRYQSLLDVADDPDIKQDLQNLYDFDDLCYTYQALKSYYEASKSKWDSDYRNLLHDFPSLIARVESKLPIDRIHLCPGELPIVRREFQENARLAGKIASQLVTSAANLAEVQAVIDELRSGSAFNVPGGPAQPQAHDSGKPKDATQKESPPRRTAPSENTAFNSKTPIQRAPAQEAAIGTTPSRSEAPAQAVQKIALYTAPASTPTTKLPSIVHDKIYTIPAAHNASLNLAPSVGEAQKEPASRPKPTNGTGDAPRAKLPSLSDYDTGFARSSVQKPVIRKRSFHDAKDGQSMGQNNLTGSQNLSGPALSVWDSREQTQERDPKSPKLIPISSLPDPTRKNFGSPPNFAGKSVLLTNPKSTSSPSAPGCHILSFPTPRDTQTAPLRTSSAKSTALPALPSVQNILSEAAKNASQGNPGRQSMSVSDLQAKVIASRFNVNPQSLGFKHTSLSALSQAPRDFWKQPNRAPPLQSVPVEFGDATSHIIAPPKRHSPEPDMSARASEFCVFKKWSLRHVECAVQAATYGMSEPVVAMQIAFSSKFGIRLSDEAAGTLFVHYGLDGSNYQYKNQVFQSVVSGYVENSRRYVSVPWAELRTQFSRKAGLQIEDWEIKGRYDLYLLHTSTFGKLGEPSGNYVGLVETYNKKRLAMFVANAKAKEEMKNLPRRTPTGNFKVRPLTPGTDEYYQFWTPDLLKIFIESSLVVHPQTQFRRLTMMYYVKERSGILVSEDDISVRAGQHDIMVAIKREYELAMYLRPDDFSADPATSHRYSQFAAIVSIIACHKRPSQYYERILKPNFLTDFWDLAKSECILSTVNFMSDIHPETRDASLRNARDNIGVVILLRLLSEHSIQVSEASLRARLIRMMEFDIFGDKQCRLLSTYFKKPLPQEHPAK